MRLTIIAAAILLAGPTLAFAQDTPPPAQDAPAPDLPPAPTNPEMVGPQLLISTSMGDITLQLDAVHAPIGTANVMRYAKEKHYDGTVFYRVVKGFVVQMGSWDANVKGRPIHDNIAFEGANGLSNLRGTVAYGHGEDPNSASAEFFINLSNNTGLNHVEGDPQKMGYAVFGQVVTGMEVADAMSVVATGDKGPMPGQAPIDPILIKKVSVLPSETWRTQCAAGQIAASSCEAALTDMFKPKPAKKPLAASKPPDSKSRRSGR